MSLGGTTTSSDPATTTIIHTLDPGNSPPLILAFIGIGIFGVGLSILFGYRRVAQRTRVVRPPPRDYYTLVGHFNEPKFFDVWICQDVHDKIQNTWATMTVSLHNKPARILLIKNAQPLSATCPSPILDESPDNPTPTHAGPFSFFPWKPQTLRSGLPLRDPQIPHVQVAVLISMPRPPTHVDETAREYQIGLTEIPCSNG
jgi:hypothetical protein